MVIWEPENVWTAEVGVLWHFGWTHPAICWLMYYLYDHERYRYDLLKQEGDRVRDKRDRERERKREWGRERHSV